MPIATDLNALARTALSGKTHSMKSIFVAGLVLSAALLFGAEAKRPDFLAYNADGSVRLHGVYEADNTGRVTKYTVFDGGGKLRYTEIPYYAPDGRIIRADHRDANGKLTKVVVYFDKVAKVFDENGVLLESQAFSQDAFHRAPK